MTEKEDQVVELKRCLRSPKRKQEKPVGLSTGSTLINLACSGNPHWGFLAGAYYYLVGDSTSGKTFLALTCFAEACRSKHFRDYRLIHDNGEDGALMNVARFFGEKAARKIEAPGKDGLCSTTVEEFYVHLDDAITKGLPFVYVLDSQDSLSSEAEGEKFGEQMRALRRGSTVTGSFGDGKAKKHSSNIRRVLHALKRMGSILLVIGQTRDNIGFGSQYQPKTRSGGRALTFYATLEMWSSVRERLKCHNKVRGKEWQTGILARVQVKKNRITGRETTVDVPILWSHGIDDVGSCVDFLTEYKHWREKDGVIQVPEWDVNMPREELVQFVEEADLIDSLRTIVGFVWASIEKEVEVKRKPRYE